MVVLCESVLMEKINIKHDSLCYSHSTVVYCQYGIINSIPDKAATSSSSASYTDAKRQNIATSAKIVGSVDGGESMDVDVTSVTSLALTNQMKGVTNAGLNLQREPLQKNAGGNSEKGTVLLVA